MLAELKSISCCPTHYRTNQRVPQKAVDRRASTLPREYLLQAQKIDREYGGVAAGVVGPVEAKLLSFPPLRRWVFGAWGEASEDVHIMVDYLAESRQRHQQLLEGRGWRRRSEEAEVALFKGQIRRTLSLEAVRAQARLLLDRLLFWSLLLLRIRDPPTQKKRKILFLLLWRGDFPQNFHIFVIPKITWLLK